MIRDPAAGIMLVERLLSAMPDLRQDYETRRRDIVSGGFVDTLTMFYVSDVTMDLRGRQGRPPPDRAGLARWLGFFEREWGVDPEVDKFISDFVLSYMPSASEDRYRIRDLLGPQLLAALVRERDVHADPAEDAFLAELRRRFPDLEEYVEDSTYGDHDALLTHHFLSDVVRHAVALHLSADPAGHDRAQEIVDAVAAAYGRDASVDNLIAVSFVENLPNADEPGADIVRRLPAVLVPDQEALRSDLTPLRTGSGS